ncbi:MAG: capsid cement protein [Roseococcus sp.]
MITELIVNRVAGGAVGARRIVMPHSTAGQFVVATASGKFFGVCFQPGGAASGERMDIALGGLVEVVAGGTIAAGDPVTSDASGAAVIAAPAAGVNARVLGFAHEAAVAGDIFRVLLSPHTMQG